MPAALKGLDPNKDGVPLCFDRNLAHGCKRDTWQTPAGLQCEKGLHLCMKCGSPDHGAHACSNWCLAVGAGFATSSEALSDGPAAECVAGPSSAASEVCTPAPQLDAVRISPVVPALAGEPTVTVTAHAGRQSAFDSNFSHPASQPLPAGRAEVSTQVGTSERSGASDADALSSVPARAPEVGSLRACVAVELFAGSCRLSKCLRSAGFETIAVDVKDAVGHQALKLDLLSAAGLTVLWDVLSSGQILYVHMAPPCDTASAARFIPGGPRPLRDVSPPDGLDGLSFLHRCQVRNANRLYAAEMLLCFATHVALAGASKIPLPACSG